jgi:hypothetical protein
MSSLNDGNLGKIGQQAWILTIICAALAAGVLVFAGVAFVARGSMQDANAGQSLMVTTLAFAFVVLLAPVFLVVPRVMVSATRKELLRSIRGAESAAGVSVDAMQDVLVPKLMAIYQAKKIVAAALLEGVAFFLTIAFMVEGHYAALAMAVILAIGILLHIPSKAGLTNWIDAQLDLLDRERQNVG